MNNKKNCTGTALLTHKAFIMQYDANQELTLGTIY